MQEYVPVITAWAKVRGLLTNPERAERRRQRRIRSAVIGQAVARGDGGHQADTGGRDNPDGGGGAG